MKRLFALALGALAVIGSVAVAQDRTSLAPTLAPPVIVPTPAGPALATPPAPAQAGTLSKADLDAWLDGYLPYALKSGDIAGAQVAVVKDGQILTARGYGFADVEKRRPVDPATTLFRPGSVSKLVTWTAVMQLVSEGQLDLDADVNQYLDFKIEPRHGKPVTLRNLLQHTAGFEETGKDLIAFDPKNHMSLGAYLKRFTPKQIFVPGSTPAYSNWGTALAGYIVERKSGRPFDDYIEQRIFAPLGMSRTSFRQPLPARLKRDMALGYSRASEKATPFEIVIPAPAGSMSSSTIDMARFMIAHLQGGALGGNRILSPQAWQQMHNSPLTVVPPLNRMQLGFFETNVNGRPVNAHLGDTLGFHSSLHLLMRDGVGFYVSFNSGGKEGAAGTLRSTLFHDFADRYFPAELRDGRVAPKIAADHAKLMAGNWIVSRRWDSNFLKIVGLLGQAKISTDDKGGLVIPSLLGPNGKPRKWIEIAPFVWRDANGEDRVAAKVVDGKPVRWSMDFMSPFMVFDRVPASQSAAWVMPALYASLAVLVLTFLYWPGSWLLRRRFNSALSVTGDARRAYRGTRIAIGLVLAVVIGWTVVVTVLLEDIALLTSAVDIFLWLLQIVGLIALVAAVLLSGWNVWLTWKDGRGWTRKLWSVLVLLACLILLYVFYTFGLLAMTVNY